MTNTILTQNDGEHGIIYYLLLHVLLNIVTICLVTRSVIARISEPISDCSCIDIGPLVHPHRPDRPKHANIILQK